MALATSVDQISYWHEDYDSIDWDVAMVTDPKLRKVFSLQNCRPVSIRSYMIDNKFDGCTINIICNSDKENLPPY